MGNSIPSSFLDSLIFVYKDSLKSRLDSLEKKELQLLNLWWSFEIFQYLLKFLEIFGNLLKFLGNFWKSFEILPESEEG